MVWKLTEQIRQRLLQGLESAIDKDESLSRFDELRQQLQEKSGEFGYALRSDKESLENFHAEIFHTLKTCFSIWGVSVHEEKINQTSQNLLESFLQSVHYNTANKADSKFQAEAVYGNLRKAVSSLSPELDNGAVAETTSVVFGKLVEILRRLLENSDEILLAFNRQTFDALLFALDEDRDRAGLRYEEIRQRLIRQFHVRGSHKPQSHADEVFNRVARQALGGIQLDRENPFGYFHETARFVLLEYQREVQAELLPPEDLAELPLNSISATEQLLILSRRLENEIGIESFKKCRAEMSDDENLVKDFYDYGEGAERIERRKSLAAELGVEQGTLRKSILDFNNKIKNCARKKLEARLIRRAGKSP